jgi:hypothetical protein
LQFFYQVFSGGENDCLHVVVVLCLVPAVSGDRLWLEAGGHKIEDQTMEDWRMKEGEWRGLRIGGWVDGR